MQSIGKKTSRGFTLIELLVGIVVGLLTVLAITESFALFEGRKRTSIGGATAEENGLLGSFMIERDARMAGFGLGNTGCTTIKVYNANATPNDFTISGLSITITQNTSSLKYPATATEGTDTIEIVYSTSPFGSIPAILQMPMPDSSAILRVDNGIGFLEGQLVLISQPPLDCTVVQASQNGQQLGIANLTGPGTQWNLQHNPGGSYPFNPPGGHNIFPAGGYTTGAKVLNMGSMVHRRYYISGNNLMVDEMITAGASAGTYTTQTLVNGIVSLKAQYGRDTGADGYIDTFDNTAPASIDKLVALRFGLLARVGVYEKDVVTGSTTISLWPSGPTATITTDEQHYRYKPFYTTVPLRNTIWNNNP